MTPEHFSCGHLYIPKKKYFLPHSHNNELRRPDAFILSFSIPALLITVNCPALFYLHAARTYDKAVHLHGDKVSGARETHTHSRREERRRQGCAGISNRCVDDARAFKFDTPFETK